MFQDKVDNVQELFDDGPEKSYQKELDRAAQNVLTKQLCSRAQFHLRQEFQVVWLWRLPFPQILRNSMAIL